MYPSSNIPNLQQIQAEYRKAAERARGRNVAAPFAQAANLMALGRAEELEALNRQQIQADQQARAQQQERGFEMLGGNPAGEQRFRQAVAAGGRRYNQAASQLGIQQAQAEQARDARADAMDLQATGAGMQFAAMERKEQMQMQLAQLQAAQNQLNRDATKELSMLKDEADKRRLRVEVRMAQQRLNLQKSQILAGLRRTQMQNPQFGGGTMTASYSSGAGNFKDHLRSMGVTR